MRTDVVDLRDFYETSMGHVAQRMIRRRMRALWPDVKGQRVLGLGYATPLLRPILGEAERVAAAMPAGQGVLHWPPEGPNRVMLVDEAELPLPDVAVDRLLLVHALEHSEQIRPLLRECWRVLASGGRMLVVVPNRRGVWALVDRTPFGFGQPYSVAQLSRLLRENMFTPERVTAALYIPPVRRRIVLASAPAWEKIGQRWFKALAGVIMVEASKTLYAAGPVKSRRRSRVEGVVPTGTATARSGGTGSR